MSSQYDSIKTATHLVREVKNHGLSTLQDDICRAQDIFGRSSIEEMKALANDIGRNNRKGEADPNGSHTSSRQPTRSTFYAIAFRIWNWEQATRFWNEHSNPQFAELKEAQSKIKDLLAENQSARRDIEKEQKIRLEETSKKLEYEKRYMSLRSESHSKGMEIMELKAKLYDMMTAKEEVE